MDTNPPRHDTLGAAGIDRLSYRVPDAFFPLQDATTASTTTDSSQSAIQQWSNHFQGPRTQTQLRAWSRIELPAQLIRNFSGTVMKRVGLPIPRTTEAPTKPIPALPANIEVPAIAEDGMPTRRVLRRLNSYEAPDEEWQVKGEPLSSLEMTGLKMQARADVADSLSAYPTALTRAQIRQRRAGHYVQMVPLKRRAGTVPTAGNTLRTYTDAMQLAQIKSHFRVPRRRFSVLPRPQITSPTLSPIALLTPGREPVTPAAVMEPPRCMSDAKSPTKRSPRHRSPPIKTDGPRISEPTIKLLPATTPKIEPSPTKPASPPPATPLAEIRNLRNSLATPSTFPKAAPFGTAFAGMQRLSGKRPGATPWNLSPTKLAATPCPTYRRVELPSEPSPAKRRVSAVQTPARSVVGEPATPRIFNNISFITADVPSPIASISALFPPSPAKQSVDLPSGTPRKPTSFDFGTASPVFNSVTWLNSAEATPRSVASVKKNSSRRLSEPLIRGSLKVQNRRQTISPHKLVFRADKTFSPRDGLLQNRRLTFSPLKFVLQADQTSADAEGLLSPVKKSTQATAAPIEAKPSVSPVMRKTQKPRRSLNGRRSFGSRQAANEVVNIDMRQNPDIFGSKSISLSVSPVLGAALPSIAETGRKAEDTEEVSTQQLFSPSAEIESRGDVEQTARAETAVEPERAAVQEVSISPVVDSSIGGLGIFDGLPALDLPLASIEEHAADAEAEPSVIAQSPSPVTSARASSSSKGNRLSSSPTLTLSFTPVNNRSPSAVEVSVQQQQSVPESPPTVTTEIVETVTAQSHDYDSPGRDYMREFIRRSRPKRPSTTEAGSPVGSAVERQPLGPKSPNTESPSKNKRKLEKEHDQPLKRSPTASPKKIRRYGKTSTRKDTAATDDEEQTATLDVKMTDFVANADDEKQDDEMDSTSRRSSRLRNQTGPPSAKSAIPTSIKMRRNGGPPLNSAVRIAQQELTYQTRANTQKNKADAEYPAQFLAKQQEQAQIEQEAVERETSSEKEGRKCVNWSNPLAIYQEEIQKKEEDKPERAKSSKPKTVQMSGIAKPVTRAKTTAEKERTARLAEHFGMVSNGTPAKPQRSTRSRMRI
ncbi:hypothetical protein LEL_09696 [Akanthomyces lecanii RCEF 1005]|uniref:Uncharacterized protein n=1 Tax=Akanthomyces lecanii RCEF 1005 TaxID=1081108 RepID=A0A168C993_CORDF|nr:hypothetical protein LEL_09696 [Akanthomyces lecanii RCEF 1005]